MLKLLGLFFMLIDHIGVIFFPKLIILRVVGRMAFPLFAYQVTISYRHTKDLKKYCKRLFVWGLISQIPYSLVFGNRLNVMFTLFLGVVTIYLFNQFKNKLLRVLFVLLILITAQIFNVDYGAYGIFIIFILYILPINLGLFIAFEISSLFYGIMYNFIIQIFSPLSLLILKLKLNFNIKFTRYLFYAFYPLHILILFLIKTITGG